MILFYIAFLFFFVQEANSSDRKDDLNIFACTRHFMSSAATNITPPISLEHCYLMLSRGNSIEASRGYFQDVGSADETDVFGDTMKCFKVKSKAKPEDWDKVVDVYAKYEAKDYNLVSRNCCSVAQEAVLSIAKDIPSNIKNANSSIGTWAFYRK